jgi:hypothetical protein
MSSTNSFFNQFNDPREAILVALALVVGPTLVFIGLIEEVIPWGYGAIIPLVAYYLYVVNGLRDRLLLAFSLIIFIVSLLFAWFPIDQLKNANLILLIAVGAYFFYVGVRISLLYKATQLLPLLFGLFFVLPNVLFAFSMLPTDLEMLYYFGSIFVGVTIMYNDNVWENYRQAEKYLLLSLMLYQGQWILQLIQKQF